MNSENICTDRLADVSDQTSGLIKLWASLIGGVLLCASAHVSAQVCESERQEVIAATQGGNRGDTLEIMGYVNQSLMDGGDFRDHCDNRRCAGFRGIHPASPEYGEALRDWANIQEKKSKVQQNPKYGRMLSAQYIWHSCIALHMAAQIKPKRKHQ